MFAAMLGAGVVVAAVAHDPLVAVQLRYPVHRTSVSTGSGTIIYYSVPADSPPELRRAYKGLEVAEREVLQTEAAQLIELESTFSQRRLEALRSANEAWSLMHPDYANAADLPYQPVDPDPPPAFAFGSKYSGGSGIGSSGASVSRSAGSFRAGSAGSFRTGSAGSFRASRGIFQNSGQSTTADRALQALDRLASAQEQLHQTLLALAYPDRPRPVVAAAPSPAQPAGQPAGYVTAPAAQPRPPAAPVHDWAAARRKANEARQELEAARRRLQAERDRLQAERDRLNQLRARGARPTAPAATPPRSPQTRLLFEPPARPPMHPTALAFGGANLRRVETRPPEPRPAAPAEDRGAGWSPFLLVGVAAASFLAPGLYSYRLRRRGEPG